MPVLQPWLHVQLGVEEYVPREYGSGTIIKLLKSPSTPLSLMLSLSFSHLHYYICTTYIHTTQKENSRQGIGERGQAQQQWSWRRLQSQRRQEGEDLFIEGGGHARGRGRTRARIGCLLAVGRETCRDRDQDKPVAGDGALGGGAFQAQYLFCFAWFQQTATPAPP